LHGSQHRHTQHRSVENREHARVPIQLVVGNFAIGKKADQRKIAERFLDHFQFSGVFTKQILSPAQAGIVQTAPGCPGYPTFQVIEHALHVFAGAITVAPAELKSLILVHEVADSDTFAARVDTNQVAYQVVTGIRALDRQSGKDVAGGAVQVTCQYLADILFENIQCRTIVDAIDDIVVAVGNGVFGGNRAAALA